MGGSDAHPQDEILKKKKKKSKGKKKKSSSASSSRHGAEATRESSVLNRAGDDTTGSHDEDRAGSPSRQEPQGYESIADEKMRARARRSEVRREADELMSPRERARARPPPETTSNNAKAPAAADLADVGAFRIRAINREAGSGPTSSTTSARVAASTDRAEDSQQVDENGVPVINAVCVRSDQEVEQEIRNQIMEEAAEAEVFNIETSSRRDHKQEGDKLYKTRRKRNWFCIVSVIILVLLVAGGSVGLTVALLSGDDGDNGGDGSAIDEGSVDDENNNGSGGGDDLKWNLLVGASFETGWDGFSPPLGEGNSAIIVRDSGYAEDGEHGVKIEDGGDKDNAKDQARASIATDVVTLKLSHTEMELRFDFTTENFFQAENDSVFVESSPTGSTTQEDERLWTRHERLRFGDDWTKQGPNNFKKGTQINFEIPEDSLEAGTIVVRIRCQADLGYLYVDNIKLEIR